MKVSVRGVPLNLSALEYRADRLFDPRAAAASCRNSNSARISMAPATATTSNAIEVLVGRVRRKLGVDLIETRRGFGYLIPEQAG